MGDTLVFFFKNNFSNSQVNTIKQIGYKKKRSFVNDGPITVRSQNNLIFCRLTRKPKLSCMWMLCYTLLDVEKPLRYIP